MTRLIATLLLALLPSIATAHDWYPWECCSDNDCRVVAPETVRQTPAGFALQQNGETLPYTDKRVRVSPDGQYHLCTAGGFDTGRTLCLFTPSQSF